MRTLRHLFRDRPALAALLLAAVLCLRIVLPAGTMPTTQSDGITVMLCSGGVMTLNVKKGGSTTDKNGEMAQAPCTYAPLSAGMLAGGLAPIVAAALAFVFVAAILREALALRPAQTGPRPPGQGPPLTA